MKASHLTLAILALAILIVGVSDAFAKGGHSHGMSRDGYALLHTNPNTSFGYAPAPGKSGGHSGQTPFALPDLGSANVMNFPGRLP
jgi:hypothetical protein